MLSTFANVSCPWWNHHSLTMRQLIHSQPVLAIVTIVIRPIQVRRGSVS